MSISDDNKELNEILSGEGRTRRRAQKLTAQPSYVKDEPMKQEPQQMRNLVQWTTGDDKIFVPASKTAKKLLAGAYEIQHCPSIGIYFHKIPVKTEGLLRFPQTNSEKVVREIENFWNKEKIFQEYGLTYKRGIILWGPAGGGKSCTIQLIMKDVIEREGIVVKFAQPSLFIEGMRILREIERLTPIVVLMEDIDSILEAYSESEVLNILDGIDEIERTVFLATTNYPELLGARILNRPSRFDKRFKIDYPNTESRMMYLKHLVGKRKPEDLGINLNKWVKDTERFTIAHLKELFIAVVILGDDYHDAVETLRSMKEFISSEHDNDKLMGFGGGPSSRD